MSTQPIQPAWKQEVNQRLAAHKNRKGAAGVGSQQEQHAAAGATRAAEAAARVAARYAKTPTYSQMQAEEARAAVRAAEIATQVAMEAQAAAASALAELHAAAEQPLRGPAVVESISRPPRVEEPARDIEPTVAPKVDPSLVQVPAPSQPAGILTREVIDGQSFNLRWEPDLPSRAIPMPSVPQRPLEQFELAVEDWWTPAEINATLRSEPIEVDAAAAHANLIEFPRELIAARKLRPRLAEAGGVTEREAQLSIFEVDPGTVSFEPMASQPVSATATNYKAAVWSGIELDAHPAQEKPVKAEVPVRRVQLAPIGLRSMAVVMDLALILGTFSIGALWLGHQITHLPAPKTAELLFAFGLLLTGFAYHALFFAFTNMTPGMRYAGIALCTFDDDVPTRLQLRKRLGAMAVSLLPVGLGIVWSVFDDDHLSWHDRISCTYLRRR
ncbi:RDD family protein [Acidobacteria bacterium AB60]|nr:RDD family protein [Acidobacteria bacterium AB60]